MGRGRLVSFVEMLLGEVVNNPCTKTISQHIDGRAETITAHEWCVREREREGRMYSVMQ